MAKKTAKKTSKKKTAKKSASSKKKTTKKKAGKKKSSKKPGLWANIHKAQARAKKGGRPTRKKGQKGAPTDKSIKKAQSKSRKKK